MEFDYICIFAKDLWTYTLTWSVRQAIEYGDNFYGVLLYHRKTWWGCLFSENCISGLIIVC